jgi:uncharacterized protein (DUF3084 family)
MINNDTSNIKFTDEQTRQLEEFKTRLSNTETEISIANKNLGVIKKEIEKSTKEKIYQEELLAEITPKVEAKQSELKKAEEDLVNTKGTINKLNKEITEKTLQNNAKIIELENREIDVIKKEKGLSNREANYEANFKILKKYKDDFDLKVAKLKEVISIF